MEAQCAEAKGTLVGGLEFMLGLGLFVSGSRLGLVGLGLGLVRVRVRVRVRVGEL